MLFFREMPRKLLLLQRKLQEDRQAKGNLSAEYQPGRTRPSESEAQEVKRPFRLPRPLPEPLYAIEP
jgi:hypothetical protein